ncbi:hypothetical protein ANANG_G00131510 [Anguilla anguilla]|uniref:PDZ domain-containing protein n=1 Tax=Anguilla anguilla TaxID=7936 RepID=A0A9D3RYI9_ANGAN|nr:hypothetical protein ANANG_G00131510 [Anguilla anguilla]
MGDSDVYTVQHVVWVVEEGSPAHDAGLRAGDLITHVNGESVRGLLHTEVVELLLRSGSSVALQTTALENTSIKLGPARKTGCGSKMVRRTRRRRRRDAHHRRRPSVAKKLSRQPSGAHSSRAAASALHQSMSSSEWGGVTYAKPLPWAGHALSQQPSPELVPGLQLPRVPSRAGETPVPPGPGPQTERPGPPPPERHHHPALPAGLEPRPGPAPRPQPRPSRGGAGRRARRIRRARRRPGGGARRCHGRHREDMAAALAVRRLSLSERRDGFRKQEAVREPSFDGPTPCHTPGPRQWFGPPRSRVRRGGAPAWCLASPCIKGPRAEERERETAERARASHNRTCEGGGGRGRSQLPQNWTISCERAERDY